AFLGLERIIDGAQRCTANQMRLWDWPIDERGIDMNTIDESLSIEIIRDFHRAGYSYFKLPKALVQEAESLAALLYDLDIRQRIGALATAESGVLGYYPSEIEASEIAHNSGTDISTWTGSKSRGYSSYDFIEEPSAVLGVLPVLRTNIWIPGVPVFRER